MSIKKIVAFTGIRSDYDLLSKLYSEINKIEGFELKLIVSGAHLSETMAYSVQEIIKDGIPILAKIESLLDSNSLAGRVKSLSILMQGAIHSIVDYNPDLIIVVGDREEVLTGATIGTYLNIPVAHFFGGDHSTDGHVDNPIRHATSKLANIHFVSNEVSEKRLLAMGEEKSRIFNIGSPSLDKFKDTPILTKEEVFNKIGISMDIEDYALLIFHPEAQHERDSGEHLSNILDVLKEKNIFTFVGYPNSDSGQVEIINTLKKYSSDTNFFMYKNLPRDIFVNLFRNSSFLIGNSSMGIYEAPMIKKPVINVGNRQVGRYSTENVLFVDSSKQSIKNAIHRLSNVDYIEKLQNVKSIYGDGQSTQRALKFLQNLNYSDFIYKITDPLEDLDE
ncbi:UDP-N-acetylglucosamine 2-epimerase [Lysinibacillus sp. FSL K6-3209]|uniref:UDP-N-acetylglucosamine 2-epimerase n=1 Tax=Lysinibacillus sp. FSL K6-3209 TaxID=2921497 RepID=UPI0030DBD4F1